MPPHSHLPFVRHIRFIFVFVLFVALLSVFSLWPGSISSAESAIKSSLAKLASSQPWADRAANPTVVGSTITVNSTSDLANGTDGLCTLREAIAAANTNTASGAAFGECAAGSSSGSDTIDLIGLTGTIPVTSVLPTISSDVTISGPGAGVLTIQRNTSTFTVIDIGSSATVAISGLTVQGSTPDGIGISNSGTLSLTDCVVRSLGLGVANGQHTLTISNCVISGNTNGGGISNSTGTLELINSEVSGNDSHGGFGPGIYNSSGTLHVVNSTITGNSGHRAIMNGVDATATFVNSTVSNNSSGGFINNGNLTMTGGLVTGNSLGGMVVGGTAILDGVTITNNTENFFGGGGLFINGTVTVVNCLIANNTTTATGGGIRNGGGKATLINTTISGNTSNGPGGGLNVVDGGLGSTIAINVTITGNLSGIGGGVYRESGPVLFKNSLIAGNFMLDGTTPNDILGTVDPASSFNLIGVGGAGGLTGGVNNNQVGVGNPGLGALADNGGPTLTHELLITSPALDAADNCVTQASHCGDPNIPQITTDQRGFNRSVDGPDVGFIATVDVGAYERQRSINDLPDVSSNEDIQLVIPFQVDDLGSVTSLSVGSDNPTLIPNDGVHLTPALKQSTGIVTITPAANLFGTVNITVIISRSGGNGSDTKIFLVTVNSSNDAPTFTKGADQLVNEDAAAQTVPNWATGMSAGPPDESGQSLSFQITNNTNVAMFSAGPAIDSAGTLTYTPAANANGLATITVVLKDTGGTANGGVDTSAPQTLKINITAINDAPSFTKGTDRTVLEDSGTAFISGWATNISAGAPNESDQSLIFQMPNITNPGLFLTGPTITSQGALTFTPAPNANGSSDITISLKDNAGTANGGFDISPEQTFTITITPVNDPPSFTKGPNQVVLTNAGAQSVANWATNISAGPFESNQTVSFEVDSNTNPSLFTVAPAVSPTGTLTFQSAPDANGSAFLTVKLKDNGGTANGGIDSSLAPQFIITVTPVALQFNSPSSATTEGSGSTTVTVVRTGNLSQVVTVDYLTAGAPALPCSTNIGVASSKCDFTLALGTLTFAAGEDTKTITILISQDSFVEGAETFFVTLSRPTGGAAVASPAITTVTINDDAHEPPGNPIDDAENFVRQHYHDFLNREPDQSGLAFWTSQITSCGADQTCIELKRINVSAAFYLSIEFQQTGYLVERIYKAAYGDVVGTSTLGGTHQILVPVVRSNEFLSDTQRIGQGVVVNVGNWEQQLENNKQAFTAEFVLRTRFTTAYPATMTAAQFVDKLNLSAGNPLSPAERDQLVADLSASVKTRAEVLRAVAEDADLNTAESNRAFVLMEYFGYLRRNPNDPQDIDYTGYEFWLTKLNQFNGNFVNAEMVKAFITSPEYRQRFGP